MGNHDDEPPAMNRNVVKGEAEQRRGKSNSNSDALLGNLRVPIKTDKFGVPLYDVDPDENRMPKINFYYFSRHFPGSDDEYRKRKKRLLNFPVEVRKVFSFCCFSLSLIFYFDNVIGMNVGT
ncbi:unnamed protein product [Prunus brigantina]